MAEIHLGVKLKGFNMLLKWPEREVGWWVRKFAWLPVRTSDYNLLWLEFYLVAKPGTPYAGYIKSVGNPDSVARKL
jgi:hypothetical protein